MLRTMELLRKNGLELREPYTKALGRGIFELHAKHGTDISRVLYFFMEGQKIIFTNGFIKKTSKTPGQELKLAKRYRKEYEKQRPEFDIIQAIIDARKSRNMTQKELAERTGIDQADISKLENGYGNPTLGLLKRLAEGMDMVMKLEFIPKRSI